MNRSRLSTDQNEFVAHVENVAKDLFDRKIVINPYTAEAFFIRFASMLYSLRLYYLSEPDGHRQWLVDELLALHEIYLDLDLPCCEIDTYITGCIQELENSGNSLPQHSRSWRPETLTVETLNLPTMHSVETLKYYKWVASNLKGLGEVIELGCWLGSSTNALCEGLSVSGNSTNASVNAYDSFRWEVWMEEYVSPEFLRFHHLNRYESFLNVFLRLSSRFSKLIQCHECYLGGNLSTFPSIKWEGRPIELFIYGMGPNKEMIEKAWSTFSPCFIPGETIIVFEEYGNVRAEIIRHFCMEHSSQLTSLHKPASSTKAFLFQPNQTPLLLKN